MATGIGIKNDRIREIELKSVGVIKTDAELIAEAIHRLINTSPLERPRESFGCRVKEVIFEPNDYITGTLGTYYISDGIQRFEPRAVIERIGTLRENNILTISVIFRFQDDPNQLFRTNVRVQQ